MGILSMKMCLIADSISHGRDAHAPGINAHHNGTVIYNLAMKTFSEKTPEPEHRRRKNSVWRIFRRLVIFAAIIIFTGLYLISLLIDSNPLVAPMKTIGPESAMQAKSLMKKTVKTVLNAHKPVYLSASAQELNSLMMLTSRAIPRFSGNVNVTPVALLGAVTFRLPDTPLGRYFNVLVIIVPSSAGLEVDSVKFGELSISGHIAQKLTAWFLDIVLGDQQGTKFINSIKSVVLKKERLIVKFDAGRDIKLRLENILQRLKGYRDQVALLGDPEKIRHYYRFLTSLSITHPKSKEVSLEYYLSSLIAEAYKQSAPGKAATENQAALLALAIYLGDTRFESFIGAVRTPGMKGYRVPHRVVLSGRTDLRLHFIFSAALKIMSIYNSSIAIGEFKELLDSDYTGSGFSFVDLAADRAGIRFAEMATGSEDKARHLQQIMKNAQEKDFFPDTDRLIEGLNKREFKTLYGDINSAEYKAVIRKIDRRLDLLPLYRKQSNKE